MTINTVPLCGRPSECQHIRRREPPFWQTSIIPRHNPPHPRPTLKPLPPLLTDQRTTPPIQPHTHIPLPPLHRPQNLLRLCFHAHFRPLRALLLVHFEKCAEGLVVGIGFDAVGGDFGRGHGLPGCGFLGVGHFGGGYDPRVGREGVVERRVEMDGGGGELAERVGEVTWWVCGCACGFCEGVCVRGGLEFLENRNEREVRRRPHGRESARENVWYVYTQSTNLAQLRLMHYGYVAFVFVQIQAAW